jgi:hypothetical protein
MPRPRAAASTTTALIWPCRPCGSGYSVRVSVPAMPRPESSGSRRSAATSPAIRSWRRSPRGRAQGPTRAAGAARRTRRPAHRRQRLWRERCPYQRMGCSSAAHRCANPRVAAAHPQRRSAPRSDERRRSATRRHATTSARNRRSEAGQIGPAGWTWRRPPSLADRWPRRPRPRPRRRGPTTRDLRIGVYPRRGSPPTSLRRVAGPPSMADAGSVAGPVGGAATRQSA